VTVRRDDKDHWVFPSGKIRYANTDLVAIEGEDGSWELSYGYDGTLWTERWDSERDGDEDRLSDADLLALAEFQMARWHRFIAYLKRGRLPDTSDTAPPPQSA
jgi:hypothetical protein